MSPAPRYVSAPAPPSMPLIDRVMRYLREDESTGCWVWTGGLTRGYGRLRAHGRSLTAHRVVYEAMVGEIPEGLQLDHLCRNRACSNPEHLDPVPPRVNTLRGTGHGSETHCPQGHPYSAANTYRYRGRRYCRECNRIRRRKTAA